MQTEKVPVLFDRACWTAGVPVSPNWALLTGGIASTILGLVPADKSGFHCWWASSWRCFSVSGALEGACGASLACFGSIEARSCLAWCKLSSFVGACFCDLANVLDFFLQHSARWPMCLQKVQVLIAAGHSGDLYLQLALLQPRQSAFGVERVEIWA